MSAMNSPSGQGLDVEKMRQAIYAGDTDLVRQMLDDGFPIEQDLHQGLNQTPLHVAALSFKNDICVLLLERGANIETRIPAGMTPLASAAGKIDDSNEAFSTCELLLKMGANPNSVNEFGQTVLHEVIKASSDIAMDWKVGQRRAGMTTVEDAIELARLLVSYGARSSFVPDETSIHYTTPFQAAVEKGAADFVRYFLHECGEDVAQRTVTGRTMRQLCKDPAVKTLLLAARTVDGVRSAMDKAVGDVPRDESSSKGVALRKASGMGLL